MISHAFVSMALLVGSGLAQNAQAPEVVIRSSAAKYSWMSSCATRMGSWSPISNPTI
jgi:hypothetical protein